jgi:hypothetical protein
MTIRDRRPFESGLDPENKPGIPCYRALDSASKSQAISRNPYPRRLLE